jgi:energy-coupling factor transport system substrate-specific component
MESNNQKEEVKAKKERYFKKFTVGELVILAVLGIVFGIGGTPMVFVGRFFMTALGSIGWVGFAAIVGWFYLAGVLGVYINRKPGAGIIAEVISGVAQILSGNPNGAIVLVTTFLQGLMADAAFAINGYKKWTMPWVCLSGAMSAFLGYWVDAYFFGITEASIALILGAVVVRMISGALFGILGVVIFRPVAKTGVLRGTALDQEVRGSKAAATRSK